MQAKLRIAAIADPGTSARNKTGEWRTHKPVIDRNRCTYCGVCEIFCPDNAIEVDVGSRRITLNEDYCKGCGICANECPEKCIQMILEEK